MRHKSQANRKTKNILYGEEKQVLKFENIMEGGHGCGGGDGILAEEFYDVLSGKRELRTSLKD